MNMTNLQSLEEKLQGLINQRADLDKNIRSTKLEIAREHKEAFATVDALMNEYPIKNVFSAPITRDSRYNRYSFEDEKTTPKGNLFSTAYDCPHCGIVTGECLCLDTQSDARAWEHQSGHKGKSYYCKICDSLLGTSYSIVC
jgi:hypothetical protein